MRFPDQAIGRGLLAAELKKLVFLDGDGRLGYLKPEGVDEDENIVEVEWKEAASEIATFPEAVAEDTWVAPGTKKARFLISHADSTTLKRTVSQIRSRFNSSQEPPALQQRTAFSLYR